RSFSSLPLQSNLRSAIDSGRNGDVHFLARSDFTGTVARWTRLRGHLPSSETNRARTINSKSALAKRYDSASTALGTNLHRRPGRTTASVTGRTLLVHFEIDRHRSAARCTSKWYVESCLYILSPLRTGWTTPTARASSENRSE